MAEPRKPSTKAGRIITFRLSGPNMGSQPNSTEKSRMSIRDSQNSVCGPRQVCQEQKSSFSGTGEVVVLGYRRFLLVSNARVNARVNKVYNKIHQHENHGHKQRRPLSQGIIPSKDAIHDHVAKAPAGEDNLDDQRSPE